jgi:hypothetical protein
MNNKLLAVAAVCLFFVCGSLYALPVQRKVIKKTDSTQSGATNTALDNKKANVSVAPTVVNAPVNAEQPQQQVPILVSTVTQSQSASAETAVLAPVADNQEPVLAQPVSDKKGQNLIDETPFAILSDESIRYYVDSLQLFSSKKFEEAALSLRKGTAFLKLEFDRASNKGDDVLLRSVDELEAFSIDVAEGKVKKSSMERFMSRALFSLANHEYYEAYEYWVNKDMVQASKEILTLTTNLEKSLELFSNKKKKDLIPDVVEIKSR